jgi:hypothetical protein
VPKWVTDANGNGYAVPDDMNASDYGASEGGFDPAAPFGSNAAMHAPPPEPTMSQAPQATPVSLDSLPDDPSYVPPAQPAAPPPSAAPQPQGPDYNKMSNYELGLLGLERYGGRKAVEARDAGWQNVSQSGGYDARETIEGLQSASVDQKLAAQAMGDAQLAQNQSEIEMARRRTQQLDYQREEAQQREFAIKRQVDKDRAEYEALKKEHAADVRDGDAVMGTPAGALGTIFGMLAIGLAARGSRENLNATISAVQGNIARQTEHLKAQTKAKGEMADNAYARFLRTYGDADQAEAATKALMNERAISVLDRMGKESRDPVIQANSAAAIAEIEGNLANQLGQVRDRAAYKGTQGWDMGQKAQAATAGGVREMSFDKQLKNQDAIAGIRGKNASTENTSAETQKHLAEAGKAKAETGDTTKMRKDFSSTMDQMSDIRTAQKGLAEYRQKLQDIYAERGSVPGSPDAGLPIISNTVGEITRQTNFLERGDIARELQDKRNALGMSISRGILGSAASDSEGAKVSKAISGSGGYEAEIKALEQQERNLQNKLKEKERDLPPELRKQLEAERSAESADVNERPGDVFVANE